MKKTKQTSPTDALIDEWLKQGRNPEDVQALLRQFTKQVVERAMQGEMAEHLGYEKHDPDGNNSGNSRNGTTSKTLKGDSARWKLRRRATVMASSNPEWSRRTRRGGPDSMTKFCRCTREG